jgi:hypothetical protein
VDGKADSTSKEGTKDKKKRKLTGGTLLIEKGKKYSPLLLVYPL